MKGIFAFITLTVTLCASSAQIATLSEEFINSINQKQSVWIAGRNFPEETTEKQLFRLAGHLDMDLDPNEKPVLKVHPINLEAIPASFDARTKWPNCASLKRVRDQGNCGSCWAFAATESLSDRICIHSSGAQQFIASPEDVMTCCNGCGSCDGGNVLKAFNYYISEGVVSGGDVNSNEGCQPYSSDPFKDGVTPTCSKTCRSGYSTSYASDKHFGRKDYRVSTVQSVEQIQTELMTNGPLSVSFKVFQDFYSYKSGVYYHVQGNETGSHAVKLMGWGTENGLPYWLIANSWGVNWGNLGGFFKIRRGANECGIENYPYAVLPKV